MKLKLFKHVYIKKIAFCFLIYNDINHEELWHNFFKNIDPNKYTIYIHYKDTHNLKYFNKYVLNNCIETEYGKLSIILASNLLFTEALKDSLNYKFVLLSGACIPLKSFDYIYNFLTNNDYSHFRICLPHQYQKGIEKLSKFFDKDIITKAHQWCILNRIIVKKILEYGNENIIKNFNCISYPLAAPDEFVYITLVRYLKLDRVIYNNSQDATTFTNWERQGYLKNYKCISIEEIKHLLNSKSLFGRKFNIDCFIKETNQCLSTYLIEKLC
jgi:hypothetical protein